MKSDKHRAALSQTITVLLGYFGENQQWERVTEVISYTKRIRFKLNVIQFTALINVHGKANQFDQVVEVFEEMKRSGVEPNNVSCCSLIASLTKSSDPHHAEPLLEVWTLLRNQTPEMETDKDMTALSQTITVLLVYFGENQQWERVTEVISYTKNVFQLGAHQYNTLLSSFGKANNLDALQQCLETMMQKGATNAISWQIVIQHLTKPSQRMHVAQDDVVEAWKKWRPLAQWGDDSQEEGDAVRTWVNLVQYFGSEEIANWEVVGSLEKWMLIDNFTELQKNNKRLALTALRRVYHEAERSEDAARVGGLLLASQGLNAHSRHPLSQ
eukprot:TRINITY_DN66886_c0_g1_i12.p1 TRINITY_DN66886_c0_g1~~TRINITY_DN66886_c0_g1_i12.p1  ORF type:complete len:372 (-),score=47.15 TRINITY_DN66886_c0_g1_i12:67-1050(-)